MLTEVLRDRAERMPAQDIDAEVAAHLKAQMGLRDEAGLQQVVAMANFPSKHQRWEPRPGVSRF